MGRIKLTYVLLLGSILGTAACDHLCEDGQCIVDICNPAIENCEVVDTATEDLCPDGEIVSDGDRCVADGFCYALPDGRFCTGAAQLSCPEGYTPETVDLCSEGESPICFVYAEGFACRLSRVYTVDECEKAGAMATPDPGDGSLRQKGCPDEQLTLGYINNEDWDEGGLCCQWLPD